MTDILIEEVSSDDLLDMEVLYQQSVKNNSEGFIQDFSFHPNIKDQAKEFQNDRGSMIVLKENGKIVGMGGLKKENDKQVTLCKIHVAKEKQGKGYGKKIINHLKNKAKDLGYEKIILDVVKSQINAINAYKSIGFEIYDDKLCEVTVNGEIETYDCFFMKYDLQKEA